MDIIAKKLNQYQIDNNFATNASKGMLQAFETIARKKWHDESIYICFSGICKDTGNTLALVITDRRILRACKGPDGKNFRALDIEKWNSVSSQKAFLSKRILFDAGVESFGVDVAGVDEKALMQKLEKINRKILGRAGGYVEKPPKASNSEPIKRKVEDSARTAEEMYALCVSKGFSLEKEKKGIKHFTIIENLLMPDEIVVTTFMGTNKENMFYAFAVTNKRIIAGNSWMMGENSDIIDLSNINNISLAKGFNIFGEITIDTLMGRTVIQHNREVAKLIHAELNQVLYDIKNAPAEENRGSPTNTSEIREYKALLDDGIITQQEFDAKKKELLGL